GVAAGGAGVMTGEIPTVQGGDFLQAGNECIGRLDLLASAALQQILKRAAQRWLDAEIERVNLLIARLDILKATGLRAQGGLLRRQAGEDRIKNANAQIVNIHAVKLAVGAGVQLARTVEVDNSQV